MQRRAIRVAMVAGPAVVAIALAIQAQTDGGATVEASRLPLHAEPGRGAVARHGATPSPLLTGGDLQARLESLRGRRVVLNAWASWCPPCREELPLFADASADFADRVAFLGADLEDSQASARRLLAEIPLGYPSYATSLAALGSLAPTTGTPFTVLVDQGGQVVGTHIGAYRSQEELDTDVSSLLTGS